MAGYTVLSAAAETARAHAPPPPPTIGDALSASYEAFRRVAAQQVARIEAAASRAAAAHPTPEAGAPTPYGPHVLP